MTTLEEVYTQLHATLVEQHMDTAFAEFTAESGEYDAALFDLCFEAVQHSVTIPANLADQVLDWLTDTDQAADADRAALITGIRERRAATSPN